jgi:pentatricopeptide repeat protein
VNVSVVDESTSMMTQPRTAGDCDALDADLCSQELPELQAVRILCTEGNWPEAAAAVCDAVECGDEQLTMDALKVLFRAVPQHLAGQLSAMLSQQLARHRLLDARILSLLISACLPSRLDDAMQLFETWRQAYALSQSRYGGVGLVARSPADETRVEDSGIDTPSDVASQPASNAAAAQSLNLPPMFMLTTGTVDAMLAAAMEQNRMGDAFAILSDCMTVVSTRSLSALAHRCVVNMDQQGMRSVYTVMMARQSSDGPSRSDALISAAMCAVCVYSGDSVGAVEVLRTSLRGGCSPVHLLPSVSQMLSLAWLSPSMADRVPPAESLRSRLRGAPPAVNLGLAVGLQCGDSGSTAASGPKRLGIIISGDSLLGSVHVPPLPGSSPPDGLDVFLDRLALLTVKSLQNLQRIQKQQRQLPQQQGQQDQQALEQSPSVRPLTDSASAPQVLSATSAESAAETTKSRISDKLSASSEAVSSMLEQLVMLPNMMATLALSLLRHGAALDVELLGLATGACIRDGRIEDVGHLLSFLRNSHIVLSEVFYAALVRTAGAKLSEDILVDLGRQSAQAGDVFGMNILLSYYVRAKKYDAADATFASMLKSGPRPDSFSFYTVMLADLLAGRRESVGRRVELLVEAGLPLTTSMAKIMVRAWAPEDGLEKLRSVLFTVNKRSLPLDSFFYFRAIEACALGVEHLSQRAKACMDAVDAAPFGSRGQDYGGELKQLFSQAEQYRELAESLFNECWGKYISADRSRFDQLETGIGLMCEELMRLYHALEDSVAAARLWSRLEESGLHLTQDVLGWLAALLCRAGQPEAVRRLVRLMMTRATMPSKRVMAALLATLLAAGEGALAGQVCTSMLMLLMLCV